MVNIILVQPNKILKQFLDYLTNMNKIKDYLRLPRVELLVITAFLSSLILITYWQTFNTFFQQDEWYFAGQAIYGQYHHYINIFSAAGSHFCPFATALIFLEYNLFGLHGLGYAIVSISLHIVATILLFYLVKSLTRQYFLALISSIIFAIWNAPQQAVTWFAASPLSEPAVIFALLTIILWRRRGRCRILSLVTFIIGLLFKEDIFTLLLTIPLLDLAFPDHKMFKFKIGSIFPIVITSFIYFVFRMIIQLKINVEQHSSIPLHQSMEFIINNSKILIASLGYLLFSPGIIITFLRDHISSPKINYDMKAYILTPQIAMWLTVAILAIWIYLAYREKWKLFRQQGCLLLIILISFTPYLFLGRDVLLLESRYFYFPMVFASIFFATIMLRLFRGSYFIKTITVLVFGFLIIQNVLATNQFLSEQVKLANYRYEFIGQIQNYNFPVKDKTVIYFDNMPPNFQSGVGQMTLVLTARQNPGYHELLKDYYLWNIGSQGYQENGGYAFGYFDVEKDYNTFIAVHPELLECVIMLHWDPQKMQLTPIVSLKNKS